MKKLKCKKVFGTWFYEKTEGNDWNELDAPIYEMYDEHGNFVMTFGSYGEMKMYVENNGNIRL